MPLDWLNTPIDRASVSDLIVRKKRARAIEALRAQFQQRVPSVHMRLQLADLLVMAGRAKEAVPILMALADEFARDGFVAKAVAILKRVERIEPGREDVQERLGSLVQEQLRLTPTLPSPRPRRVPEIGIEEIREGELEAAPRGTVPPSADDSEPVLEVVEEEELAPVGGIPRGEEGETLDDVLEVDFPPEEPAAAPVVASTETLPPLDEPPPPEAESPGTQRIRNVFRRFLGSLGTDAEAEAAVAEAGSGDRVEDQEEATDVPEGVEAVEGARAAASDKAPEIEDIVAWAESAPPELERPPEAREEPALAPETEEGRAPAEESGPPRREEAPPGAAESVTHRLRGAFKRLFQALPGGHEEPLGPGMPAAGPEAESLFPPAAAAPASEAPTPTEAAARGDAALVDDIAPEGSEPPEELSDEDFQDRLLDLIEDVLQRPVEATGAVAESGLSPAATNVEPARRLVAVPLFGDLAQEELLAVVQGLCLHTFDPGEVVVTEGEVGESLYILTTGAAKVFVHNPRGRNIQVAQLAEGDFFGEISCLSGRPRSATLVASQLSELLELDKSTLDAIARTHPRVRERLEALYLERAGNPEAAAVRAVDFKDRETQRRALQVLEAHFGESRWDPRMRLRLANVLLKAGKHEDAVPILIDVADELTRRGFPEKGIALLKKIERIQRRNVEEVNLAPLRKKAVSASASPSSRRGRRGAPGADAGSRHPKRAKPRTDVAFDAWIVDLIRDTVRGRGTDSLTREAPPETDPDVLKAYGRGLAASPLFEGFSEEELLAVIRRLQLLSCEPGDVVLSEGEEGESLFVLAAGTVQVHVRNRAGRNVFVCTLDEGAFFGEIAALSGKPRSATVTAATACELLELDRDALDAIVAVHPRVREVLETFYVARATHPGAAAIRGLAESDPAPS